ncbi:MAG TPA: phage tail sheath C-terminal domain-containing protein [Pyrinomonadaceae bacterium]|jgi:hypothetical protein|nr:phage tail sheath C-terminal domain-containing protein [Pyrinomonadaceae bacterium]
MPEYLSPGVYVEEVSSGIRPIEGVGTSTGAFIGVAEKGPIGGARYEDGPGRPVLITNFGDFTRTFGGFINGEFLAYAVQQFFGEGGTRCYVTRTAHFGNPSDPTTLTATRASAPLGGASTTTTAALAAGATSAPLTSAAGIAPDMLLFITDGTNTIRARVTAVTPATNTVTFTPAVPAGTTIATNAAVTQASLIVNAIYEGAWGNNLRVGVTASGRVATTLSSALAAGATTATVANLVGLDVGMTLLISQGANFALVQVTQVDPGTGGITFRVMESSVAPVTVPPTVPLIPVGGNVTGIILGKASTVLRTAANTPAGSNPLEAVLESTEGITVGSVLLFISRVGAVETVNRVLVNRVVGNRVFFAAPGLTAAFPAGPPPAGTPVTVVTSEDFTLTVYDGDDVVETHANLSLENTNLADYVEDRINLGATRSRYIRIDEAQSQNAGNTAPIRTAAPVRLGALPGTAGVNGDPDTDGDYIGSSAVQTGFFAFDTVDDINILAAPGITLRPVILAGMSYCENRADVFYVSETPPGIDTATAALDFKNATGPLSGQQAFNSKYGAIYWPWVRILDPLTNRPMLMPPSGAIAGSYSATDVRRGVHKAPAGIEDGFLNTAIGIEKVVTKGEHDVLNPQGVNVIRSFPGLGIVIWGARTTSRDPEWRYVNVRRLFLFLEESIDEGTQWVVFEPNDPVLWARIVRNVSAFLRVQWLEGKLVGLKEEEAFFVKCDEETNPPESVDLGRVITVIGVAPSKPAEFVIFRIMQKRPGANG